MRDAIQNLANAAIAALIKSDPSALAIEGGKVAISTMFGWLPQKGKLEGLIARVDGELQELAETEFRGRADLEPAIGNATILFERFGLTSTELVDLSLRPDRATDELLTRGKEVLGAAGEAVAGLCAGRIVPRVHELLLDDPQTIAELSPAIAQALLSQREAIERLPDEVGRALRRTLGRHLMIDPTEVWRSGTSDIYLLRAEYGVVPFHEQRRPDVDRLLAWCEGGPELAVRVITGAGGTGKTRLMIELCRQARMRGWRAGFLHREVPLKSSWELDGLVEGDDPLLLVVDYAETKRDVLVPVLRRLSLDHGSPKTRVILVARAISDWLPDLRRADPKLQELLDETRVAVEELSPIALPAEQRPQIVEAAAAAFAARLPAAEVRQQQPDVAAVDLSAAHFANALFLHIAALAAVVGDAAKEADALLRFVLVREERHWRDGLAGADLNHDLDVVSVRQTKALITLAGGVENNAEAQTLLGRVPHLSGLAPPKRDRLIDLLHRLYPGERHLEPLRPDLLGEELVDRALSDDLLKAAFAESVSGDQVLSGLTVLTRLAKRRSDAGHWLERALASDLEGLAEPAIQVAIETGHPMGKILAQALEKQPLADPLRLEPLIPKITTELLDVGVVVMAQRWSRIQAIPKPWTDNVKEEAARVGNDLANRLGAAGQNQKALAVAHESVGLYRALAEDAPDAYQPELATALNNLSNRLSDVRQHREALAPAKEAVAIFRKLADKEPDIFQRDLAMALNNRAGCLSAVGRHQEALKAAQEATDLYRKLAEKDPDAYQPYFAGAIGNLANCLSEIGEQQQALVTTQKAADLYRALAAKAPDAYRPALASALYNLAIRLSEVGQREAALAPAEEAVAIRRELAAKAPDAYGTDLAKSLNTLAICLADVDQRSEALRNSTEAVRTLTAHFLGLPEVFAPSMEPIVETYMVLCSEVGVEPDMELLAPIIKLLQRMRRSPGGEKE